MKLSFEQFREGIHQSEENILLAGKVKVERTFGCVRLADDIVHFGVVIALAGKDRYSGFEDPFAGFMGCGGGVGFYR